MPIYVHLESADVWAHQSLFNLDEHGHPMTVTGVPPDYFCAEGQLWGNPQYNWALMEETGFHGGCSASPRRHSNSISRA